MQLSLGTDGRVGHHCLTKCADSGYQVWVKKGDGLSSGKSGKQKGLVTIRVAGTRAEAVGEHCGIWVCCFKRVMGKKCCAIPSLSSQ